MIFIGFQKQKINHKVDLEGKNSEATTTPAAIIVSLKG